MADKIVIVGSGIAGMCSALALARQGFSVTLLERDAPPPEGDADKAFFEWSRRGAAQFRHPHAFLGLMCNLLEENYPDLLEDFYRQGARRLEFKDILPPTLAKSYRPQPGDEKIWMLMCRRAIIETVLRRYVEQSDGVEIVNGVIVEGFETEQTSHGTKVTGVRVKRYAEGDVVRGDVVIDASGRTTKFPKWFEEQGMPVPTEDHDAEIVYYTRHYRFKDGVAEPSQRGRDRSGGDLGYIKFGIFPGDNGNFALIVCLHRIEEELIEAVKDGETFDAMCRTIPGLKPWIGEDKAVATTHSFGMADIRAQWRHYVVDGKPVALNFFAVGDAAMRTNPAYGRGCSTGILHAHLLADVLTQTSDPLARALAFDRRSESELRPIYVTSLMEDRRVIKRAVAAAKGHAIVRTKTLSQRLKAGFAYAIMAAAQSNVHVFRGVMRTVNLLEKPGAFLNDWKTRLIVLRFMMRGRKRNAQGALQRGPSRTQMLALVRERDAATAN